MITHTSMESFVTALGFDSEAQMHAMVSSVNLSDPVTAARFRIWKLYDGSRIGLEKIVSPVVAPTYR